MRRFSKLLIWSLLGLAALVLLSPYWLGAVLPAVGRRFHATFSSYSRIGYSRFVLENVTVARRTVTVKVARAEADTPWLWAWRHLTHTDHLILADNWEVAVHPSGVRPAAKEPEGWRPLQAHLSRIANGLETWLRLASIGTGRVTWPKNQLSFEHAVWNERKLHVNQLAWRGHQANVDLLFARGSENWQLQLDAEQPELRIAAENVGESLSGEVNLAKQKAPFKLQFGSAAWIPKSADITAENWTFPGSAFHLSNYPTVQGSLRAIWDQEHWKLEANAAGQPLPASKSLPLKVALSASGDREQFSIQQVQILAPGLTANLDRPVNASFSSTTLTALPPSTFRLSLDLGAYPATKASGQLNALAVLKPQPSGWPVFDFQGNGSRLEVGPAKIAQLSFSGVLAWPRLKLFQADLVDDSKSRLRISGEVDFAARTFHGLRADGHLSPAFMGSYRPRDIAFGGADVAVIADGPFSHFTHQGTVAIDELRYGQLQSAAVGFWWEGEGMAVRNATVGIHVGNTEVVGTGSARLKNVVLTKLIWRHGGTDRLSLRENAQLSWANGLDLRTFDLLGPAGELHLSGHWGEKGEADFFARAIDSAWWRDVVPRTSFAWTIEQLTLHGSWDHGPVAFNTTGKLHLDLERRAPVELELAVHTEGKEIAVQTFRASEAPTELAHFSGKIPVQLFAGSGAKILIDRTAPVAAKGRLNPDAPEWGEVAQKIGISLVRPDVDLALSGTLERPQGSLRFAISEVQLGERFGARKWPKIEALHGELAASAGKLTLDSGEITIAGQTVQFSGVLPTGEKTWSALVQSPWTVIRNQAEASLRIKNADLEALAPLVSPLLLPQGRLDADLTVSDQKPWNGYLHLRDVATRPIGSLGLLRNIHADLSLHDRQLTLSDVEIGFGERPVKIAGEVDFPRNSAPKITLTAMGEDLPFVREAGLLVRGNINLTLTSAARKALRPIVRGSIVLTDGLFVSDVRSLIPRGGSSPERRPPYFSVETEPFKDWRLDVNVEGDRFLRARTTVFTGTTSMKFHLLGTLGEPRALGELRLNEGQVSFPFAQFSLNDATIRLTDENPYDPTLGIFGTSRRYGYDLTMEVTGVASAPVIAFTSNPSLSSEQVLLMVMAGEVPRDEITYSNTQRLSRLGTFFGQSLLGSLSGGRGEDRLTITSGEEVSITGRETYDVEYAVNDRWSLVGEYDQFDDYNAGVKWRIIRKNQRHADEKK